MQSLNDYNARVQELSDRWVRQFGRRFDLAVVILAAVNTAAACLMIAHIIYDARALARRRRFSMPKAYSSRFSISSLPQSSISIHPAEVVPLVVSMAIIGQGTTFVAVQTTTRMVVRGDCAAITQIIWPKSMWTNKQGFRLFGPSDLEMTVHITSPVLLEKDGGRQFEDDNHKLMDDIRRFSRAAKYVSSPTVQANAAFAQLMDEKRAGKNQSHEPVRSPTQAALSPSPPRKSSNYSIFPTFRSAMLRNSTSTTFSQDTAEALPPPRPLLASSHRRDISEQSSATVQIGCRLSNLDEAQHHPSWSPRATSFRIPFYGRDKSSVESPPESPLSNRVNTSSGSSQDVVVLPIQSNKSRHSDYLRSSRLELIGSYRQVRQQRQSRPYRDRYRRMTMKALPPDPPPDNSF
ncbi:MAG: hypothetical protein Q9170_005007 [Blastenia crenularia]